MLHIGMSVGNNGHAQGLRQVFDSGEWQYEEINVGSPNLNEQIIHVANNYRPDLVWIQIQSLGLSSEAIQALKANGAWICNWCGDKRSKVEDFYFHYSEWGIDLTCFSNMEDIEIMRKCGHASDWLQIGYDPHIYYPNDLVQKDIDITFMGNHFGHFPLSGLRRDMVNELKRIYGDGFKAFGNSMPDGSYNGNQNGEADIYRRSKIGINLSHFDTPRYTSDRMFRMLGCGITVLSHKYKDIHADFNHNNDHDLVMWNDLDDLKRQINYLLQNWDIGKKIGEWGHELALQKFTFKEMAKNIEQLYNQYKT